jgi:hypothetical protein
MPGIPEEYQVIILIIVGKHSNQINQVLSEIQVEAERTRPERMPLERFVYFNRFTK